MIIIASYSNVSVTYTADGTQTVFSFPFDYLRKAFVKVESDGNALEQGADFSVYEKTVVFTEAPVMGTALRIFRETDTTPLVSWADASVLRAKDMTIQQIQVLHILEEYKGQYDDDLANMLIIAGVVTDSRELQHIVDQLNLIDNNTALVVDAVGEVNQAKEDAQASATSASDSATQAENLYEALIAQGGHPFQAATIADMTDTTKIYVYIGNEAGYTSGNWYYYDGTAWVSGGVYNAVAFTTDTTLTVSGAAADSKVTGEQLGEVTRKMVGVVSQNLFNYVDSTVGWISNTGTSGTNSTYCWVKLDVEEGDILNSYSFAAGSNSSMMRYVCPYDSNGNVISGAGAESVRTYTVPSGCVKIAVTIYSATKQYFVLMKNNESAPTEYIPYFEPYYKSGDGFVDTDKTLTLSNVPADAKAVGDKIGEILPITPSKTSFMYASKNLVDPSSVTVGYYINPTTGLLSSNSNYSYTDYIPVTEGTNYGVVGKTSASLTSYFAWYNSSKTRIAGGSGNTQADFNNILTAPTNASFLRYSTLKVNFPIDIEESDSLPQYEPYGYAYVLPQYMPPEEDFDVVVNLPSKIYATVGYELNIYFENIVENWEKYQWDVACSVGKQMARGYTITPAESNVGTYTLSITLMLGDKSKTVQTSLVIVSANAGSGLTRSIIILGDSTTANGIAVTKLHENFANDPMTIETWGTQGTAPNNHEGRSGWKLEDYFTKESVVYPEGDPRGTIYNGFYNPATHTFDASYYFTNSGISEPNWFIVNMGINDMFSYTTDSALESAIEQCVSYIDDIITSVQGVSSDIKIAICLTIPPNHSQDAFGKAYNCSQTRDRYKHNNLLWVHRLIEEYDNRTDDGIFVIPIFTNLDTIYNMGMESMPVNARNTETTYQSPILNGGVHPVTSGYWQIADVYTAFLKKQA